MGNVIPAKAGTFLLLGHNRRGHSRESRNLRLVFSYVPRANRDSRFRGNDVAL